MILTRETRGEMKITCKNCHFVTKYSVSYIEDAISDGLHLTCSVCEEKFMVVAMPLIAIAAEQPRALDLCEVCPNYLSCPGVVLVPEDWQCAKRTSQ